MWYYCGGNGDRIYLEGGSETKINVYRSQI